MATVEVFVDDAVRGRLPTRCVITGEPTTFFVREEVPIGNGLGVLWLLILLGPIGWLALTLAALTRRADILTVRLPITEAPFQHLRSTRRTLRAGVALIAVCAAGMVAALIADLGRPLLVTLVAIGLVGVALSVVARVALAFQEIDVSLDASRRWVTLRHVSVEFADAVRALPSRREVS